MKLNEIKPNKANPRVIKDDKFRKLVKSIQDFPDMMNKRPIVVDTDGVILGGNMRYKALLEIYGKNGEIPNEWVVVAKDWTDEQKRQFIIKDNASFGEWNVDELLTDWDKEELSDWGVDVKEKQGINGKGEVMYEAPFELTPSKEYILVLCEEEEFEEAREFFGCGFVMDTKAGKKYAKVVKSRTINFRDYVNSNTKQK